MKAPQCEEAGHDPEDVEENDFEAD